MAQAEVAGGLLSGDAALMGADLIDAVLTDAALTDAALIAARPSRSPAPHCVRGRR
jgi:uncharacterized protein YjbI with pentapeptide repeats